MKGVIMAGGFGTRLRPLTYNIPKPMVPLVRKPVMEYCIALLKYYGVTDIAVTLQYLPEIIKDYFGDGKKFGVRLHYFEETTPLGTAGSIKNAEPFLDERFIVMSGDGLTDFNLAKGIEFHEQKKALSTIFMKKIEPTSQFGVVMTNEEDEVVYFCEKPCLDEVFSNTVNTGIYIFEPEILQYLDKDVPTDFGRDLFPQLINENKKIFGYRAEGYWCDVGNVHSYRQAQYDLVNKVAKVKVSKKKKVFG